MRPGVFAASIFAVSIVFVAGTADPWPHRKPGLWQLTTTMQKSRMPPMTSKYCIDQATEASLMSMGQGMLQSCPKHDVHVTGGTGTIDTICKFGKHTHTAHAVITFTGNMAYKMETHDHVDPPMPYGGADYTSTIDAQWNGPCPSDMKPGDIVMANGMRMHMGSGLK